MDRLTVSAQALKQGIGMLLAVEVRNGSGNEVQQLGIDAFKVWSVRETRIAPVKISIFNEVATGVYVAPHTTTTIPAIEELGGLYILLIATPPEGFGECLFAVHVTGPLISGEWFKYSHASCIATVANPSAQV